MKFAQSSRRWLMSSCTSNREDKATCSVASSYAASRNSANVSKQIVHHDAQHTEGSLVFQAFGGLVELLQTEFCVFVELVVVEKLAHGSFAAIHFLENFTQVCHGEVHFVVE